MNVTRLPVCVLALQLLALSGCACGNKSQPRSASVSLGGSSTGSNSPGMGGLASAAGGAAGTANAAGGAAGTANAATGAGGSTAGTGGAACIASAFGDLEMLSTVLLDADGPGGTDTYPLIHNAFGPAAIEAPDLYSNNHPAVPHIIEANDGIVGNHFVFSIHRDLDWDRDTYPGTTDRQRNEIKTYEGSAESLKARLGETLLIAWKFRLNDTLPVSKNFSHFFQLKGVGGDESYPLVTISGAKKSNVDVMEIRHADSTAAGDQILTSVPWAGARGQWLVATCLATFSDTGRLSFTVKTLDGNVVIAVERTNLDLWRAGDFIRPKWGIYRSLSDPTALRPAEETVLFANFSVSKVRPCVAN